MDPHTVAGLTVLGEGVFLAVLKSGGGEWVDGHLLHADKLALVLIHVVDILKFGKGHGQRGDIVVDGDGGGVELLRDGELQQAVVVGEGAVDAGNLVAGFQRADNLAVGVVNDDGAGGILDEDLVTVAVVDARDNHVSVEFVDIVSEVGAVHIQSIRPLGAEGGDVGHLEFCVNAVGEADGVGCHHVAGDISHIVDNQGVGVAFCETGRDGQGDHASVQGGGSHGDIVV